MNDDELVERIAAALAPFSITPTYATEAVLAAIDLPSIRAEAAVAERQRIEGVLRDLAALHSRFTVSEQWALQEALRAISVPAEEENDG